MDISGRDMVEIIKLRRIGAAISVFQHPYLLGNLSFEKINPSARRYFASSSSLLLLYYYYLKKGKHK
jgi:hypothetical protein